MTDPIIGSGGGGGGGGSGGDGPLDKIDECTFGLIINSSGDNECLISTTSKTSTQNTDC